MPMSRPSSRGSSASSVTTRAQSVCARRRGRAPRRAGGVDAHGHRAGEGRSLPATSGIGTFSRRIPTWNGRRAGGRGARPPAGNILHVAGVGPGLVVVSRAGFRRRPGQDQLGDGRRRAGPAGRGAVRLGGLGHGHGPRTLTPHRAARRPGGPPAGRGAVTRPPLTPRRPAHGNTAPAVDRSAGSPACTAGTRGSRERQLRRLGERRPCDRGRGSQEVVGVGVAVGERAEVPLVSTLEDECGRATVRHVVAPGERRHDHGRYPEAVAVVAARRSAAVDVGGMSIGGDRRRRGDVVVVPPSRRSTRRAASAAIPVPSSRRRPPGPRSAPPSGRPGGSPPSSRRSRGRPARTTGGFPPRRRRRSARSGRAPRGA